jgi:hypothetical protein
VILGINYPWVTCGHDFGPRPPPWGGAAPTDWSQVETDLRELRALGVSVARFWVLADGVNVPVGIDPRTIARPVPFREHYASRPDAPRGLMRLEPYAPLPPLPRAFVEDFVKLLEAARRAEVKLIPSFTSFELFFPLEEKVGGVLAQGRGALVLGERRGPFLDGALEPLLEASERYRDAIYAWEVMNEPDWVVLGVDGEGPFAPALALSELLIDAARRIARRGFVATIGLSRADPSWLAPSARVALQRLAARGAYVNQAHFYAKAGRRSRLPPASDGISMPCLLGEMPTALAERWADPELQSTEADPARYLEARLALVRERGYSGALLWSRHATDEQTRWDARVISQIERAARAHAMKPAL